VLRGGQRCAALPVTPRDFPSRPIRLIVRRRRAAEPTSSAATWRRARQLLRRRRSSKRRPAPDRLGSEYVAKAPAERPSSCSSAGIFNIVMNTGADQEHLYDPARFRAARFTSAYRSCSRARPTSRSRIFPSSSNTTKDRPGRLTYGSRGNPDLQHVWGIDPVRSLAWMRWHVPFKGAAPPTRR